MKFLDSERRFTPVLPGLDDDHVTRALVAAALFTVAMFVAAMPAWLTDVRMIEGQSVWLKLQKFNISLTVHFLTLAVLAQQLPRRVRSGPVLSFFAYAAVVSMAYEVIYIAIQGARARRSHFNYETVLESQLYGVMGVGALLLVFVAIALAIQIWRKGQKESGGYRLGSILGLLLGSLATIAFAGYMSMSGGRFVGDHPEGAAEMPFFGWSLVAGDFRPAHFAALHAMQTLPFLGLILDRIGGPARAGVVIFAILQIALASALFVQALAGRPMWPL